MKCTVTVPFNSGVLLDCPLLLANLGSVSESPRAKALGPISGPPLLLSPRSGVKF